MLDPNSINNTLLAYLGDAVIELLTRRRIVSEKSFGNAGDANVLAKSFVTAQSQSAAVARILGSLTPEEETIYKRGRNMSGKHTPKNASAVDYRRATGLESLFAYLYLSGENGRVDELFAIAYPEGFELQSTQTEENNG